MKKISSGLLVLVSSIILCGMINTAHAQTDPTILLKIAKQAQEQLQNQINQKSSEEIDLLFTEGIQQVQSLEKSLTDDDITSAKEHFLHAMKIFKQISQQLTNNQHSQTETIPIDTLTQDLSINLLRIQDYVENLRAIAQKYNASIDFSKLDELFVTAKNQIVNNQTGNALQTIHEIKQIILDINYKLRQYASQQEQSSAIEYAQKYLEQLDRLIDYAKEQKVSDDIIQKLEAAREDLSSTTDPNEIIKQIRKIISIKEQFELTKNDPLESRVLYVEKLLLKLSHSDKISKLDLENAKQTLQNIKHRLFAGEYEIASELLDSLDGLEQLQG
jgi:flagellin-specific chaperone FliS